MAIQVLGVDGNPFDQNSIEGGPGRTVKTYVLFKFSGSYVTGGDTLDLSNGGGTPAAPNTIPTAQARGLVCLDIRPFAKTTSSFSASNGQYIPITPAVPINGAALTTLKVKLMTNETTEYSAGAYAASDVLSDIVIAELTWLR